MASQLNVSLARKLVLLVTAYFDSYRNHVPYIHIFIGSVFGFVGKREGAKSWICLSSSVWKVFGKVMCCSFSV